ncbi:hypothetical protein DL238_15685 [Alteriqipengyuania lutimaris]|uniref:Uncharacterized protein n=2 Tax=Alteriqipengyuania lutimaris TaxID=1538146 RepID=A0A395LGY2_9SPHN|nr:hypothetical protein DL238_15685 [Alteriqipengyuania lutimaris]
MILIGCASLALAACGTAADSASESADETGETISKARETSREAAESGPEAGEMTEAGRPDGQKVACASGEEELFSCTAGAKRIAVCGVTNAQGQKTAQYRFGSAEAAEIVLDGGRFASVPYSGGGESQIEFANGGARYVVYSRTVRTNFEAGEPNSPEFTDGVLVVRDGTPIAERNCTANAESVDVMAGDSYGGVANELFYLD